MSKPRIWISNTTPAPGEILRVRAQVAHPMETGFRSGPDGPLPMNIVTRFAATLDGALLLEWLPETAVAQNPYIEFTFAARHGGLLRMVWTDASGDFASAEQEIRLQG
ncbi:thiosulfate oxidation carrier complex protein SoxZ [Paenirhodobacter sp.]|uniref:thiosulfate oxidation carrier complex protein SoxZ n=1 Tax=Paenirhodobacter sp. TaxID=1965326 RepID=UPI003B3D052D